MTPSFEMHFLEHMFGSGNMIRGETTLGVLVVVDPTQKVGVKAAAAAAVVVEVIVGAGARANPRKPNLRVAHQPGLDQGLLRLVRGRVHVVCLDLDQDPDLPCLLVRKEPVKAPKREV